jgi:hypothetical protein
MKYIKRFNESIGNSELEELCSGYLAYLLDDGKFKLDVNTRYVFGSDNLVRDYITILRVQQLRGYTDIFYWKNIKDDIIPLITILRDKYDNVDLKLITNNFSKIIVDIDRLEVVKYNADRLRSIIIEVY